MAIAADGATLGKGGNSRTILPGAVAAESSPEDGYVWRMREPRLPLAATADV